MPGIAGLRGTGNWGTDERPKDFRESILFYSPNGTAAIFGLTSKSGKKSVNDPEFAWWCETMTITRLTASGTYVAGDTLITVSSLDPTATTSKANYGTATNLKPGDLLLVEPVADQATFDHELIEVVSVNSDTTFTAARGAGGTTAAAIANGQFLLLIGSAYAEGTAAPQAVSRNPVKYFNYTQIFKDTYELSGTADHTKARTGSAWSNDKKRKGFDHARSIELSILFGRKSELTGSNGKPKRFMGGLREFIPSTNTTIFATATTTTSFLDAVSPCFDMDTDGGNTRLGFAGNQALIELSKIFVASTNVRINYDKKLNLYGIDFTEFVLPRGRLLMYSHPLLNTNTLYNKSMFILDFSSIKYVYLNGRDTKARDDVQAEDEDVRRGFYMTECSLMVDRGGATCAYLGKISAT